MKKIAIILMSTLLMSASLHVLAQENTKNKKDECLLYAKNCQVAVESLQDRIKKLNKEIKKGQKVYSPEELRKLEEMLKEIRIFLDVMESKP
ncbi:MAG: hypothetical protein NDI77_04870 [Geobacteraceae bacterium]|nr:hypothetical protein [Geobacteraceae bacterium]